MWVHSKDMKEAEGCCFQRAIESDYIHNQMSKHVTNGVTWDAVHSVPCELRCEADTRLKKVINQSNPNHLRPT
jgi:hypothetical protein